MAVGPPLLRALGAITGALSVLGSFAIIFTFGPSMCRLYSAVGSTTTHKQKIEALRGGYQFTLLWLAISDVIVGFAWAMSAVALPAQHAGFCKFQGFTIEFGVISSAMWTACLSYELYRFTVRLKEEVPQNFAQSRYRRYLVISWGVPLVITGIAAAAGEFASAGGWCWIKNDDTLVQLLVGYVPLLFVLLFLVVIYGRIAVWVHQTFKKRLGLCDELRKLSKLGMFPAVFFVVWFVPMIARISGAGESGPLPVVTALFAPSQGWLNALVYTALNKSVRTQVLAALACKRQRHTPEAVASGRESLISQGSSVTSRSLSTARSTVLTGSSSAGGRTLRAGPEGLAGYA